MVSMSFRQVENPAIAYQKMSCFWADELSDAQKQTFSEPVHSTVGITSMD